MGEYYGQLSLEERCKIAELHQTAQSLRLRGPPAPPAAPPPAEKKAAFHPLRPPPRSSSGTPSDIGRPTSCCSQPPARPSWCRRSANPGLCCPPSNRAKPPSRRPSACWLG